MGIAEKNEGGGYHGWGRFAAAVGFGRDSYDPVIVALKLTIHLRLMRANCRRTG
jgi:hypothetical protein